MSGNIRKEQFENEPFRFSEHARLIQEEEKEKESTIVSQKIGRLAIGKDFDKRIEQLSTLREHLVNPTKMMEIIKGYAQESGTWYGSDYNYHIKIIVIYLQDMPYHTEEGDTNIHVIIMFQNYCIDWTENSLVYPTTLSSEAMVRYNIRSMATTYRKKVHFLEKKGFLETSQLICNFLTQINKSKVFNKKHYNSIHFMKDLFEYLRIPRFWDDAVNHYLNSTLESDYTPPYILMKKNDGTNEVYKVTWTNHAEFDEWHEENRDSNDAFDLQIYSQWTAIIDHSYWYKQRYNYRKDAECMGDHHRCRFGQPSVYFNRCLGRFDTNTEDRYVDSMFEQLHEKSFDRIIKLIGTVPNTGLNIKGALRI